MKTGCAHRCAIKNSKLYIGIARLCMARLRASASDIKRLGTARRIADARRASTIRQAARRRWRASGGVDAPRARTIIAHKNRVNAKHQRRRISQAAAWRSRVIVAQHSRKSRHSVTRRRRDNALAHIAPGVRRAAAAPRAYNVVGCAQRGVCAGGCAPSGGQRGGRGTRQQRRGGRRLRRARVSIALSGGGAICSSRATWNGYISSLYRMAVGAWRGHRAHRRHRAVSAARATARWRIAAPRAYRAALSAPPSSCHAATANIILLFACFWR